MNYLQVWIGKKPKKIVIDCMNSVLDKVENNDTYTLISTTNFFKDNSKVKWIDINKYELKLKKDKLLYKLWNYLPYSGNNDYVIASCKSDLIRLHYLSMYDDTIYLDVDIKLEKKIIIKSDKPCFALERKGYKDTFISYNNNNKEFFAKILKDLINNCYSIRRDKFYNCAIKRSWIFDLICIKYSAESDSIKNEYFEHLNMYEEN